MKLLSSRIVVMQSARVKHGHMCTSSSALSSISALDFSRARHCCPICIADQDPSNPLLPKGFDKLTKVLIDANADVNMCNKVGQTALHRASQVPTVLRTNERMYICVQVISVN